MGRKTLTKLLCFLPPLHHVIMMIKSVAVAAALIATIMGAAASSTITVTVKEGKFLFDGVDYSSVAMKLQRGAAYTFDVSDSSMQGKPGDKGVSHIINFFDSQKAARYEVEFGKTTTKLTIGSDATELYYYCTLHKSMGSYPFELVDDKITIQSPSDVVTTQTVDKTATPIVTKKQVNDCEKDFKKARNVHRDLRKAILTALKNKH